MCIFLLFIQIELLQFVRDQLCFSGLSSEVQPLPSDRAGAEWQRAAGFSSEAAVWFSGESKLQTEDSEVSSLTFCKYCRFVCLINKWTLFNLLHDFHPSCKISFWSYFHVCWTNFILQSQQNCVSNGNCRKCSCSFIK